MISAPPTAPFSTATASKPSSCYVPATNYASAPRVLRLPGARNPPRCCPDMRAPRSASYCWRRRDTWRLISSTTGKTWKPRGRRRQSRPLRVFRTQLRGPPERANPAASVAEGLAPPASPPPVWLAAINEYRAGAKLAPVAEDAQLSDADRKHAMYVVKNYEDKVGPGHLIGGEMHDEEKGNILVYARGKKRARKATSISYGARRSRPRRCGRSTTGSTDRFIDYGS